MINILHITTHMGGGVGKVLSGITSYANYTGRCYRHKIILLENPDKTNFIDICIESGVEIMICSDFKDAYEEIKKADIVQLEWWNHPRMSKFMVEFPKIKTKLVVWSHISGCVYPNIPFDFIKIPSKFIFTSEYSYENPVWSEEEREYVVKNTEVINSSGGFELFKDKQLKQHDGFNIGYIGTLNYSKLNENFAKYYESVDIEDSKFTIIGDNENVEDMIEDLNKSNIYDKTCIKGYVNDVSKEMQKFDVFSYLLNKEHFGTTENVLLEAMAIGLPVVAINQCAEKYLIKHMETGILINSVEEYKEAIKYLYNNPNEARRIGQNAKDFVKSKFSVKSTVQSLHDVYSDILDEENKMYDFKSVFGKKPHEWFLSCLGKERNKLEQVSKNVEKDKPYDKIKIDLRILKEKNKGSIHQFLRYYPQDENLRYWSEIIE